MLIGTEQRIINARDLSIKVGETMIDNVKSAKLLGVVIDRFLSLGHIVTERVAGLATDKISRMIGENLAGHG